MRVVLLLLSIGALVTGASAFAPIETTSDFERDAKALELYLQDKKDHKEFCPQIKWNQPPLSTYKETLKSHLPKDCKK